MLRFWWQIRQSHLTGLTANLLKLLEPWPPLNYKPAADPEYGPPALLPALLSTPPFFLSPPVVTPRFTAQDTLTIRVSCAVSLS